MRSGQRGPGTSATASPASGTTSQIRSGGTVTAAGQNIAGLTDRQLSALRGRFLGFVFQQSHLGDGLGAVEDVATGLLYAGVPLVCIRGECVGGALLVGVVTGVYPSVRAARPPPTEALATS